MRPPNLSATSPLQHLDVLPRRALRWLDLVPVQREPLQAVVVRAVPEAREPPAALKGSAAPETMIRRVGRRPGTPS